MKLRSYGLVIASLLILLGSCFTAAATSVSDGTGDIWHWTGSGTAWSWVGNVGSKPNIDITEVSYEVNGDKITLKMEVEGSVQTAEKIAYYLWYNSTDSVYMMSYSNGTDAGFGMKTGSMNFSYGNVTVTGDTLSVVLDVVGDTSKVELWGMAVEYTTTFGDLTNEWWGDWVPNEKFTDAPTDDTDDTDDDDGNLDDNESGSGSDTPGFELPLVLTAVAVAFIILRKRR